MKRMSLNDGWHLSRQGPSKAVTLPHVWNSPDWQDGGNDDGRGLCIYERKLPPQILNGQSLYFEFEVATALAEVIVNGVSVATHKGDASTIRADITSAVKQGEAAVIRVTVDNSAIANGFFRNACLIVASPVRISLDDEGSSGVHISQTRVSPARVDLSVDVLLDNVTQADATVECVLELIDANGEGVAGASARLTFCGKTRKTLTLALDDPRLPQGSGSPYLCSLSVRLLSDGVEIDRRDIRTEIR